MITLIAAIGKNKEIGRHNEMLWHLPKDFKHFKAKTTGHTIVMGRKTLESLPGILPNRKHIVLTRNKDWKHENVEVVHSIKEVLDMHKPLFIIGGGEIYREFLPYADVMELTRVDAAFDADAFFPQINFNEWQCTYSEQNEADEKHKYAYRFETWKRKQSTRKASELSNSKL